MNSTMIPITNWLYVHDCTLPNYVRVATTQDALDAHKEGKNVVVPTLEMANAILLRTGLSEGDRAQRMGWASQRERYLSSTLAAADTLR